MWCRVLSKVCMAEGLCARRGTNMTCNPFGSAPLDANSPLKRRTRWTMIGWAHPAPDARLSSLGRGFPSTLPIPTPGFSHAELRPSVAASPGLPVGGDPPRSLEAYHPPTALFERWMTVIECCIDLTPASRPSMEAPPRYGQFPPAKVFQSEVLRGQTLWRAPLSLLWHHPFLVINEIQPRAQAILNIRMGYGSRITCCIANALKAALRYLEYLSLQWLTIKSG